MKSIRDASTVPKPNYKILQVNDHLISLRCTYLGNLILSAEGSTIFSNLSYMHNFVVFYRVDKITELLRTIDVYETLSLSRLDGIDTFNSRFNLLVTTIKKKPYEILDQRKMDFDIDYDEFKRQLTDLNVSHTVECIDDVIVLLWLQIQLQAFMDTTFESVTSVQRALYLLERFER